MAGMHAQEARGTCSGTGWPQRGREGEVQDEALWLEGWGD